MQEQPPIITEIRSLMGAQTHDEPWFKACARVMGCSFNTFDHSIWWRHFWPQEWGSIELLDKEPEQITVVWHRPDGAQSAADDDFAVPVNIRAIRFGLCGVLIQKLKEVNELSYVIPGYPREWRKCKVYLNGTNVQHVHQADAVLNHVEASVLVGGRIVPSLDGHIPTQRLHGNVRIVLFEDSQPLF